MVINLFHVISIIGLLSIIAGTLMVLKKSFRRKYTYPLLILGGICLLIYSVYINDTIFIILQTVFIISSIYGLVKINKSHKNK